MSSTTTILRKFDQCTKLTSTIFEKQKRIKELELLTQSVQLDVDSTVLLLEDCIQFLSYSYTPEESKLVKTIKDSLEKNEFTLDLLVKGMNLVKDHLKQRVEKEEKKSEEEVLEDRLRADRDKIRELLEQEKKVRQDHS